MVAWQEADRWRPSGGPAACPLQALPVSLGAVGRVTGKVDWTGPFSTAAHPPRTRCQTGMPVLDVAYGVAPCRAPGCCWSPLRHQRFPHQGRTVPAKPSGLEFW